MTANKLTKEDWARNLLAKALFNINQLAIPLLNDIYIYIADIESG